MKGKQFVRPTCNKPWCFICEVCSKTYRKWGAHKECHKRFCDLCQTIYDTQEELKAHAEKWHKKNFCEDCNMVIRFPKKHRSNYH